MNRTEKPHMVGLEITRRCNLTCPHCCNASTRKALDEFTTTEWFGIIDQLIDLGTEWIGWTGGEPLLREDLEEIIVYARSKGIARTGVTTNGILLTETRAKSLKDAGVTSLQVSIDGSTAAKNREIRHATLEDFERSLNGARACRKLGIRVDLAMLLSRATLEDAYPYLEMADREGVKYVRYCGFVPLGRAKRSDVIDRLKFDGTLRGLKEFAEETLNIEEPIAMFDPAFGPTPPDYEFHPCVAGMEMMYISCIGDVHPCSSLLDKQFAVGNARERSLRDIWNDPKMTEMARFDYSKIHGHCRDCEKFEQCHGACRGITLAYTGDIFASFPVCLKRI